MTEISNVLNKLDSDLSFGFYYFEFEFVSDFELRISNFDNT